MCVGQGECVGLFVSGILLGDWSGPLSVVRRNHNGQLGLLGVSEAQAVRDDWHDGLRAYRSYGIIEGSEGVGMTETGE